MTELCNEPEWTQDDQRHVHTVVVEVHPVPRDIDIASLSETNSTGQAAVQELHSPEREEAMEAGKRNGRKTRTPGPGPSSSGDSDSLEEILQRQKQQQEMDDDQLLLDAGIGVEEMDDDEKRMILEALRQSLPAAKDPELSTSEQTLAEDYDDSEAASAEVLEDSPGPAQSLEDRDGGEGVMEEDTVPPANQSLEDREGVLEGDTIPPVDQSLEMSPVEYDSDTRGEEGEQECDSTTTSVTAPVAEDDNVVPEAGWRQREPGPSSHPQTGDQCDDTDSLSDEMDTALMKQAGHRCSQGQGRGQGQQDMRLTTRQKEQGQSRFKELLSRTRLSQSLGSQSPAKDRGSQGGSGHSSQDLFMQHSFDDASQQEEEDSPSPREVDTSSSDLRLQTPSSRAAPSSHTAGSAPVNSQPSPSPSPTPSSPAQDLDRGGKEQEVVSMEDAETQPPEDVVEEEGEEKGGGGGGDREEKEAAVQCSPVYPMQVTRVSCSNPSPDMRRSSDDRYLTPSKLPVQDARDKRPLLHDNWFSWPPGSSVCCLHRTYRIPPRKGKEPPSDVQPYFSRERESGSVSAYSQVIVCMLDSYLQQFSTVQRGLHTLLPWGKPVRAGLHQQGTLDCKRRGQPDLRFHVDDEEEDENDFYVAQPPRLTRQKLTLVQRKRKAVEGDEAEDGGGHAVKDKRGVGVGQEDHVTRDAGDGGDNSAAAYSVETQPLDSDDDLPDLNIEPDDAADRIWGGRRLRRAETAHPASPLVVSEDSSNSLLNEQGDLYSTQLPRRKRASPLERDAAITRLKRQRRTPAAKREDDRRESPQDDSRESSQMLRLPGRKRKQVGSSKPDSKVYIMDTNDDDDDDEEVSFHQTVQVRRKKMGFVSISSTVGGGGGGDGRLVEVVPPVRQGSQLKAVRILPIKVMNDGKPPKPPSVPSGASSSSQVRGGGHVGEDSEDLMQYVEPASPPSSSRSDSQRAEPEGRRGRKDGKDGDHGAMAATAQEQRPTEGADRGPEQLIACPLCSQLFRSSVIEAHASDCNLLDTEDPLPQQTLPSTTGSIALPSASMLKRRPLRSMVEREEFVCGLCQDRLGGSGALRRHQDLCRQRHDRDDQASCSTSHQGWLQAYKIPRNVEDGASSRRLASVVEEDDVEIDEGSNDSNKDRQRTEEDRKQEREEEKRERQLASRHSKRPGPPREPH